MSRIIKVQTNFTNGEFDPLLQGRLDIQQRYNALARARNVLIQPQGGCTRRPGLQFISDVGAVATDIADGSRLVPFEFSTTQSYMLLFTNNKMFVFKNKALVTNINGSGNNYLVTTIAGSKLSTIDWCQSADTLIVTHEDVAPKKIIRGGTDATWTISDLTFDFVPQFAFTLTSSQPAVTLTPSAVDGNITLTAGSSVFSAGHVDQYIEANDGLGRARIIGYTSGTVVNAVVEIPFFNTTAIASGSWTLETGYEDVWSVSRGYPRTSTFYEGRLYFGGTKSRPTTIFASRVNDFFDFNPGETLDDDSLEATLDTDSVNAVIGIYAGRDLQIFTKGGEFFLAQSDLDPITPSNIVIRTSTKRGAKAGIKPVGAESGTYFIQRTGKAIREFLFSDVDLSYVTPNISLLSSHLISAPSDMALRKATSTDDGDLLCIINSTDGSLITYSILRGQNVVAPSLCTTNGKFINLGVDVDTLYFLVTRQLPLQATCTITVTDAANIAVGSTITITDNAGTSTTMTATNDDPADALEFSVGGSRTNNDVADNIAVGSGGVLGINALSGYAAPNPAANVITVTRAVKGGDNLTVTSSDNTRITCTNFTGGTTADKYYIEAFNDDMTTDGAVQYPLMGSLPTTTTMTGLSHLEGFTIKVAADDGMQSDKEVASGNITLDRVPTSFVEGGLDYTVEVKTLPVETQIPTGATTTILPFQKRILESTVVVYLTQNLTLEGTDFPFYDLNTYSAGDGISFFTGNKRRYPMTKYDEYGQLTLSQSQPLFFNLLAIEYQVSTETQ